MVFNRADGFGLFRSLKVRDENEDGDGKGLSVIVVAVPYL